MSKVGLVTVLFNSNEVLDDFFKSISVQTCFDYHLYIIDNTPSSLTDELISQLTSNYYITNYTHIKNETNVGVAKGNNQGIELALNENCEFVLLLNNDVVFKEIDVFEKLLLYAKQFNDSILAPKIYYHNSNELWYGGGEILFNRGSVRHWGKSDEKNKITKTASEVSYAPTCFVFVPAKLFSTVGLMDEKYFVYVDDADFMLRATKCGYKIIYINEFKIEHKVSLSTGGMFSDFSLFYDTRNRIYWIRKLFPFRKKVVSFFYVFFQMLYHSNRQNRKGTVKIFLKAYLDGFRMKLN